MTLYASEAFQAFAENPLAVTGTPWKLQSLNQAWLKLTASTAWRDADITGTYGLGATTRMLEQIHVSVEEQDHFVLQEPLLADKSEKQGDAILALLGGVNGAEQGILPEWMIELYSQGSFSFSWLTTDVAAREIFVDRRIIPQEDAVSPRWEKRKNYYVPPTLWSAAKEEKLVKHLLTFWEGCYDSALAGVGAVRALDSSLALNQMTISFKNWFEMGTLPGISTVGALFESHPLATHQGRMAMIDLVREKNRNNERIVERRWSPLTALSGRAGGVQTEVLVELAQRMGISTKVLATGENEDQRMQDLTESAEGAPYKLFAALMLTAATSNRLMYSPDQASRCEALRIFPSKTRSDRLMLTVDASTMPMS